nr:hypothetical protein [Alkalihalobacillus sp. BA299]
MLQKVQNELKKIIDIKDITPELLHKLIHKIKVWENKDIAIEYRFSNLFLLIEVVTSTQHMWSV